MNERKHGRVFDIVLLCVSAVAVAAATGCVKSLGRNVTVKPLGHFLRYVNTSDAAAIRWGSLV